MGLLSFCPHVKGALYPRIQATWWAPYFERTPHPKTGKLKSCRRQRSLDEPAELWWTTAMLYCRTATGLRACEKLNGSMGHCAGHRSCDCDITKVPVYASIVLYFWSSSQHPLRKPLMHVQLCNKSLHSCNLSIFILLHCISIVGCCTCVEKSLFVW